MLGLDEGITVPGIYFHSLTGTNVVLNTGSANETITVSRSGVNAYGLTGVTQGTSLGAVPENPFLDVPLIGDDPAVPGGQVNITSYSTINTTGDGAHGILAISTSSGYSSAVITELENFTETGFTFEVTDVQDAAGQSVAFEPDDTVEIRGVLINEDGQTITDGDGNPIEHGTFVLNKDGSFSVSFTADELAAHNALAIDEAMTIAVHYTVEGSKDGDSQTDDGRLAVTFLRIDADTVVQTKEAFFETFGVSGKPALESGATVFPDLQQYVEGLLADATAGGSGGGVTVTNHGTIETDGQEAHGIYAYSLGGTGAGGRGGSISHSAGAGQPGKTPGAVTVVANGSITTHQNDSNGVMALSAGGAGGPGGNGGAWRHGQRGGTGGTGGLVSIIGSATINTEGDYASGIVALSVGGNGGDGGSGSGAMPGGGGGYGGLGGPVIVDGDWDITTTGDKSHGIWAKSVGGNAGGGGSGGWLFGKPGGGGIATDGGSVTLHSGGEISTDGLASYGLYAQSVGGFGGAGGSSWGLFWSFGGDANSGGSGGSVEVVNVAGGKVTTHDEYSHAILAQSIGGGGGSGGGKFGLFASLGGSGASGGNGGFVEVQNDGWLETDEIGSFGIFAQSVGGGGGDGGSVGGLVSIGGTGSQTSDGGNVEVTNNGTILTHGVQSHGIFAESVGGGGGNGGRASGLITLGGDGGAGGNAGTVSVINAGTIHTDKDESYGIFAQSVGGGGGTGGGTVSAGAGVSFSMGGKGAAGGYGQKVEVESRSGSSIITDGDRAYGIFAQSVGGGGGDGGYAISASAGTGVSVAIGGSAGAGGDGGEVEVTIDGSITTSGEKSYGVIAQSIGGGGGAGGFSVAGNYGGSGLNLGLGGSGGVGGVGKDVTVDITGSVATTGLGAHAVFAQSVGGGGGDGGFSVAGSIGGGNSANISVGGDGGSGAVAGNVIVNTAGTISTEKDDAHGILAQSVGGSGGNGGFSIAASVGGGIGLNLGFGGDGGTGSAAGTVNLGSEEDYLTGSITTHGDRSFGILAQSIGGGGGNGGTTITGSLLSPAAIALGFGGTGGSGGIGNLVNVYTDADITTYGSQSHGILAQSIGGGGGVGGLSISGGVTAFGGLTLAMGGDGGTGNTGGDVTVYNSGTIETNDEYSYGIFAQSVGGKGGAGGTSGSVMVNFSSLIPIPEPYPTGSVNIALSLGGDGGSGGVGGNVTVDNSGTITTKEDYSYGILAQSVGGGGGDGGKSIAATANISMPSAPGGGDAEPQVEVQVDFAMALGGDGGTGNHAGQVDVINGGTIETSGVGAHGIFAQAVGGGGGSGGSARSMILSIDPSNWNPSDSPPEPGSISAGATLSIGGKGAAAGDGGIVNVTNEGMIITRGADAYGIIAQSVGGGGGVGGGGYHGLDWQDFGVSEDLEPFLDLLPVQDEGDVHIALGGSGASGGGIGKKVTVNNIGGITTYGGGSIGLLAQSIGGGGGIGGAGATGGDGSITLGGSGGVGGAGGTIEIQQTGNVETFGVAAHGIFAQTVGGGGGYAGNADKGITDSGINLAIGGAGGAGGDGGDILINSAGSITTHGDGAIAIFAQSVGGGGGIGGTIGEGFGFAGSVGKVGEGGKVEVTHTGDIITTGKYAHGIFAQSVGGADLGGDVIVTVDGDITVTGEGAAAIIAQSEGQGGKRNIDFIYQSGTITGNSDGAVKFLDGADNSFTNYGVIKTVGGPEGTAFLTANGNDIIKNYGVVTGVINLGDGVNSFHNYSGATLNSGDMIHLGNGATLLNEGTFAPGGNGLICITDLAGNFQQDALAKMIMEWDMKTGQSDFLQASGIADLAGKLQVGLLNPGFAADGTYQTALITGVAGVVDSGLSLLATRTAVMDYNLIFAPNGTDILLEAVVDTSPEGLTSAQQNMARHINRIQSSGNADGFAPFAAELFALPDVESLGRAYRQLSPASYDMSAVSSVDTSDQYTSSLVKRMHSVRSAIQTHDATMAVKQTRLNAAWMEGFGLYAEQRSAGDFAGYNARTAGTTFGYDYLIDEGLLAGISGGYAKTNVDNKDSDSHGDIESYLGSLYGSCFTDEWYVDSALSYNRHRFSNLRSVQIGGIFDSARSKHNGDALSAYIESGFNWYTEQWLFQPFTSLRYSWMYEDSYRESGLAGANLYVDSRKTDSLLMDLGIRISRPFKHKEWVMIPEAMVAWDHDFDIDDNRLVAAFDSAPSMKFASDGRDIERNGIIAGFGLTLINKDNVSISVNYSGEFRDRYTSHVFTGGIRVEF